MKAVAACLVLTGCFYIDPINRRPRVDPIACHITNADRPCSNESYLQRSDQVEVEVAVFDPDGRVDRATYAWSALACSDLAAVECDDTPYFHSDAATPTLGWPSQSAGVRSIRLDLEVRDDRGAVVPQSAKFFVNDPPTLTLETPERAHAVGVPVQLTALYDDADEGPANLAVTWEVVAPSLQPPAVLEDVAVIPGTEAPGKAVKRLVPSAPGVWDIQVTATDTLAKRTERHLKLDVGSDGPPCVARVQPIVPPDGAVLPIVEPTVFQVPLVEDELDAYPRLSSDPAFGTATFAWSILAPGAATRQLLVGATGNAIDFDPAAFTPGQLVELRVEVFDRNHAAIACPDDAPTCVSDARPACTQRQTWRLEVR